jgi:hypothetical protein
VAFAPRGRGQQMAASAAAACGEALLFLHADCVFPPGGLVAVERLLREQPEGSVRWFASGSRRRTAGSRRSAAWRKPSCAG